MEYPVVPVPLTCLCCGGKLNTHYAGCNKKLKDDITALLDALQENNRPLLNFRDSEPNDRVNDLLDEIGQLYGDLTITYNDAVTRLEADLDAAVKGTTKTGLDLTITYVRTYNDAITRLKADLDAVVKRTAKTGLKVKFPPADYIVH